LANSSQGELTLIEKAALAPVMLQIRCALEEKVAPVRIEFSDVEARALLYLLKAT
jgi:hypothetical protein